MTWRAIYARPSAAVGRADKGKRRVPDFLGVWPATASPAATALGWQGLTVCS